MLRLLPSLLMALLAAGFLWLFITRYWLYRECIDVAASSCIAPDGSNLIGGGAMWIVPAVVFALIALLKLVRRRR